ncbi:hypothetical protein A0J61_11706 [Choanephora cucurbitarum]|uniref:Uncharacterized protein n=1 Tax=Choanephora cucurbitarum TaxID=101091 RepID=A0A1C7MTN7_9FUNG|nr:hypothetical protein A0J61_11706 [Choanephora cucurbitarum]
MRVLAECWWWGVHLGYVSSNPIGFQDSTCAPILFLLQSGHSIIEAHSICTLCNNTGVLS